MTNSESTSIIEMKRMKILDALYLDPLLQLRMIVIKYDKLVINEKDSELIRNKNKKDEKSSTFIRMVWYLHKM